MKKCLLYFILATGHIVTSIVLEHTLYPSNIPLSQRPNESPMNFRPDFLWPPTTRPAVNPIPTTRPTSTQRPKKKPTASRPTTTVGLSEGIGNNVFLNPTQRNDCGRTAQSSNINPLISKGERISPGQWPWLVAIFLVKIEFEFQCAGSILTNRHVTTGVFEISLPRGKISQYRTSATIYFFIVFVFRETMIVFLISLQRRIASSWMFRIT